MFLLSIFDIRQYAIKILLHKILLGESEVAKIYASDDIDYIACCHCYFTQVVFALFFFFFTESAITSLLAYCCFGD